jgi:hypothetical protein
MITETDEVSAALAEAAARWPGTPAPELLRRLVTEGHAALRNAVETEQIALTQTAGALTGVFSAGDLETLRQDWPA